MMHNLQGFPNAFNKINKNAMLLGTLLTLCDNDNQC